MLIRVPQPIRRLIYSRLAAALLPAALISLSACTSLPECGQIDSDLDRLVRDLLPDGQEIAAPLAVGDFLLSGFPTDLGDEIAAALPARLAAAIPDLHVIASRDLKTILREQKLQMSDLFAGPGPEPGNLLPARSLLTGFLFQQPSSGVQVEARIIDLESGKVMSAASALIPGRRAEVTDRYAAIPLEVEFRVVSRQRDREGEVIVHEGGELFTGDLVRIRVKPNRPAHLYLFFLDSQGNANLLHPASPRAPTRVEAGELHVPSSGEYFRLDRHPGRESLLVAASLEPLDEIEEILHRLDEAAAGGSAVIDRVQSLGLRGFVGISDSSGGLDSSLGEIMRSYTGTVWCLLSFEHKP